MFTESSDIYDLVYSFKDYQKESEEIKHIIKAQRPDCKTILDIGCGTAEHHKYLKGHFTIDGIDINEKFISIARQKNSGGNYSVADMTSFDLDNKYDVIICLFSSIGYLRSVDKIVSALKCFNRHLNPNGLVILEPWFTVDNYNPGKVHMTTYDKENIKICRMNLSYVENNFSILNFQYLLGTIDKGIQHFEERHELRLSSKEEMINAFKTADFEVTFDERGLIGRGMYYGTKNVV
jgi:ubiquinone/menaquinone biosynthesis C-methylase UbiE